MTTIPERVDKQFKEDSCKIQLRDQCKHIADVISDELKKEDKETIEVCPAADFMEGVYDIEWITHQDKTYKSARIMVAGGGPNIWVNLQRNVVQGYWWGDYYEHSFQDNIGLDEYLEEIYDC